MLYLRGKLKISRNEKFCPEKEINLNFNVTFILSAFSSTPKFYNLLNRPPQKRDAQHFSSGRSKLVKPIRVSTCLRHNTTFDDTINERSFKSSFAIFLLFYIIALSYSFFVEITNVEIESKVINLLDQMISNQITNNYIYTAISSLVISLFAHKFYSLSTAFFYSPNVGVLATLCIFIDKKLINMIYSSITFTICLFLILSTIYYSLKLSFTHMQSVKWIIYVIFSILSASLATLMRFELCFLFIVPFIIMIGCCTSPDVKNWPITALIFLITFIISIMTLLKIDSNYHLMRYSFDIPSKKECFAAIFRADSNGMLILFSITILIVFISQIIYGNMQIFQKNVLIALFSIAIAIISSHCAFVSDIPDLELRGLACRLMYLAMLSSIVASNSRIGVLFTFLCIIYASINLIIDLPHTTFYNRYIHV